MLLSALRSISPAPFRYTIQFQRCFHATGTMMRSVEEQIEILNGFSACDVSDALLKLQKSGTRHAARAGYLADIVPYAPSSPFALADQPKVIAPASTMKLIDKSNDDMLPLAEHDAKTVPKGSHWADITEKDTVLIIEQPKNQTCAAVGGIMASRMKIRGLAGCVVSGRVRDLAELKASGLPIWATGRSTVGQGAEAKVYARNISVTVNDVEVSPGDIIFCDPLEGVVAIPHALIDQVIDLMPRLVQADDKVKADVEEGSTVYEAFKKHRQ